MVALVEEVVANSESVRAAQRAVMVERSTGAPMTRVDTGETRVLRVMEEGYCAVTWDVVRIGASSSTIRVRVHESSSVSVTSPAPAARGPSTMPYSVYAALGRDYDYFRGQHAGIR